MQLVKIVVLGDSGVGKTSLIEHFIDDCQSPLLDHQRLSRPPAAIAIEQNVAVYSVTAVVNELMYQLNFVDMPAISFIPGSAFTEWHTMPGCALRSAHGYVLVFDVNRLATFQYIKVIRDQLFESRKNMQNVPVYVVGNKADLCSSLLGALHSHSHHQLTHHHHEHDLAKDIAFKDLAQLVRKQWKCTYVEASARYNWHVVPLFRELFKAIEANQFRAGHHHHDHHHHRAHHKTKQPERQQASAGEQHRESIKSDRDNLLSSTATSTTQRNTRTSNPHLNNNNGRSNRTCHLL